MEEEEGTAWCVVGMVEGRTGGRCLPSHTHLLVPLASRHPNRRRHAAATRSHLRTAHTPVTSPAPPSHLPARSALLRRSPRREHLTRHVNLTWRSVFLAPPMLHLAPTPTSLNLSFPTPSPSVVLLPFLHSSPVTPLHVLPLPVALVPMFSSHFTCYSSVFPHITPHAKTIQSIFTWLWSHASFRPL